MPPIPMLSDLLLDRGFLIDVQGDAIHLTDNMLVFHPQSYTPTSHEQGDDIALLRRYASWLDIAVPDTITFHQGRQFLCHDRPERPSERDKLFEAQRFGGEAWYNFWEVTAKAFCHRFPRKASLNRLEPGMAALVKGLGAAGCHTLSCCQGHPDDQDSYWHIWLLPRWNARWAECLLTIAIERGVIADSFHVGGEYCLLPRNGLAIPGQGCSMLFTDRCMRD